MRRQFVVLLAFLFAASISSTALPTMALAQTALVVVSDNGAALTEFTMAGLEAMPQTEIVTANEFVDGVRHFRGPLAREVSERVGAETATTVTMTAANDYQVEIPVHEFFDYDAILALSMDGETFSKRDKGPIWIIYPMTQFEELQDPVYNSRLIWQLVRMDFR